MASLKQEYASVFFSLLFQAQRHDAREKLELIKIVTLPYSKPAQAQSVIKSYKRIFNLGERVDYARIKRDRQALIKVLKRK